tara:strand:+ start:10741 stop:10998 length:258 start_codon:yes stop_codon:yes gene_type:complete
MARNSSTAPGIQRVGHLLRFPLTKGGSWLVDPAEIVSIAAHNKDHNVTVCRQRDDNFNYFIPFPLEVVDEVVTQALGEGDEDILD